MAQEERFPKWAQEGVSESEQQQLPLPASPRLGRGAAAECYFVDMCCSSSTPPFTLTM
jgi:hypothetical protein